MTLTKSRRLINAPEAHKSIVASQTCDAKDPIHVCFGSKADICGAKEHVRFTPKSGHVRCTSLCLLWAKSGLMQRSKHHLYSITSSARARTDGGTVMPSAFAVLRLMTSSYFVGACTGMSAGFSPLRMRSTYAAALRCGSLVLGP